MGILGPQFHGATNRRAQEKSVLPVHRWHPKTDNGYAPVVGILSVISIPDGRGVPAAISEEVIH